MQLCKKPHLSYPYVVIVELVCFGYGLLLSVLFLCLYNIVCFLRAFFEVVLQQESCLFDLINWFPLCTEESQEYCFKSLFNRVCLCRK